MAFVKQYNNMHLILHQKKTKLDSAHISDDITHSITINFLKITHFCIQQNSYRIAQRCCFTFSSFGVKMALTTSKTSSIGFAAST